MSSSSAASSSNLFGIHNKHVLITGGSRGIGLMIAKVMASHGAKIMLASRDERACKEAATAIVPGECHYVTSNLSSRSGCADLAKACSEWCGGKLDVLVNNAGCSWGEEAYDRESGRMNWGFDKVLDLNVKALFYLTRECVPILSAESSSSSLPQHHPRGCVINIGSVAGMVPMETPTHAYDVSKAAVHHLTKKMAADLAPRGITVNAIAPGFVKTQMSAGLEAWRDLKKDDEDKTDNDNLASGIPLGRMGTEEDMAGACIYFASRAGSWCTGVVLNVDGGQVGCLQLPISSPSSASKM